MNDAVHAPRYFQNEAVAAVLGELMSVRSTLLVMATGTGKTKTFTELIRTWPGNVLVLAHRDELIEQARKRLENDTGEFVEVEKAEFRASFSRVVVGSVQTLCNPRRLRRFKPDHFGLIVVDEAHHAPSKSYQIILSYFQKAKVLGVTATPDRSDGIAMGRVFNSVAYQFDLLDAIQDGWLVPIRGHRERIESYDLSSVTKSAGDLAPGELDEAVILAVDAMVRKAVELYPDRRAIVFTPGVRSAELAAEKLNLLKPNSAIVISAGTDPDERRQLIKDFKVGKYQYFCNCAIATEGADFPDVSLIVMMRATLSRSLYLQMVGRGTRVLPGLVDHLDGPERAPERRDTIAKSIKPWMTVLDFVGNTGRHDPLGVEDVLGGKYTDQERKAAKEKAEAQELTEDYDPLANLDEARAELARMAQVQVGKIKSTTEIFDLFGRKSGTGDGPDAIPRSGRDVRSITPGQVRVLTRLGLEPERIERMTFAQASRFINACQLRGALNLASFKQMQVLAKWGVTAKNVPAKTAGEALDYLKNISWRRSAESRAHVASIVTRDLGPEN